MGWGDPLEEGMATDSSILAWRIPKDTGAWQATIHGGGKESDMAERLSTSVSTLQDWGGGAQVHVPALLLWGSFRWCYLLHSSTKASLSSLLGFFCRS